MGQIGVLAFADNVEFPSDPCYSRGLSLATPTNLQKLETEFLPSIQSSKVSTDRYSHAFNEAFRLLATVGADNASESRNNQRGICTVMQCEQKQVVQLSQRDRAAGWVTFGQKWKTIFCRQYWSIFNHCDVIGLQSYQIRWNNAK